MSAALADHGRPPSSLVFSSTKLGSRGLGNECSARLIIARADRDVFDSMSFPEYVLCHEVPNF
jgi:hypothetical protein